MVTSAQPFDRISRRYRFVNKIISLGLDNIWRKSALRAADILPGMTILDLGCGSGEMIELLEDGVLSVGIDPELAMMKAGKGIFFKIQCAGEKLPIRTGSIDRVVSAYVLRNLDVRVEVFKELHRVLKSGGKGALVDFSPPIRSIWNYPIKMVLRFVLPVAGGILSGDREAYRYLSRTILSFPQPGALIDELAQVEFVQVKFRRLIGAVPVLYTFEKL